MIETGITPVNRVERSTTHTNLKSSWETTRRDKRDTRESVNVVEI